MVRRDQFRTWLESAWVKVWSPFASHAVWVRGWEYPSRMAGGSEMSLWLVISGFTGHLTISL